MSKTRSSACGYLGRRRGRAVAGGGRRRVAAVTRAQRTRAPTSCAKAWLAADRGRCHPAGNARRDCPPPRRSSMPWASIRIAASRGGRCTSMGCAPCSTPCRPTTGRVIFISSTGVYGDADGDWVDEESPCRPTREAGRAFLAAEATPRAPRSAVARSCFATGRPVRTRPAAA